MSIFGTLSRRQSSVPSKSINTCSRIAYDLTYPFTLNPGDGIERKRRSTRRPGFDAAHTRAARHTGPGLEDVFIRSLVAAGHCRQHRANEPSRQQRGTRGWRQSRDQGVNTHGIRRYSSTNVEGPGNAMIDSSKTKKAEHIPFPEITKDEYKDMVNTYGLPSDMWEQKAFGMQNKSKKRRERYPLAPRLVVSAEQEDNPSHEERVVLDPEDETHARQLKKLKRLCKKPLGSVSHDKLWQAYCKLRTPRLRYMSSSVIRTLFAHLTWTEHAHLNDGARQRYFSLLEDCVGEQIKLTVVEWSAAMHFASRGVRVSTDHEVKDAVELWMQMEESGVQANNVTFNILFYAAVKAGRFALADTIYNELTSRNMELDRYFRVSMIYYAGAKADGDAVRKAFNDLVNAGEIVDTAVMNCVILSLIRAGEPSAAEHVFHKMNALHDEKYGAKSPGDWREQRKLFKLLNSTGHRLRAEREAHESSFFGASFSGNDHREQIQEATPIAPDAATYRLLLRWHCLDSGELNRVQELLAEKKARGFHVHGSVYLNLFAGFIIHGGFVHSAWKPSVLEAYWQEFLEASSLPNAGYWLSFGKENVQTLHFDVAGPPHQDYSDVVDDNILEEEEASDSGYSALSEEHKAPYFTLKLAANALRAFHKCVGPARMLEVWDEIRDRWKDCGREEAEKLERLIEKLKAREDWDLD
jgi:pentatricopeptide repeat protein